MLPLLWCAVIAQDGWAPPTAPISPTVVWPRKVELLGRSVTESVEHHRDGRVVSSRITAETVYRRVKTTGDWSFVLELETLPGLTYEQRINDVVQPLNDTMRALIGASVGAPFRVGFAFESGLVQGLITPDVERAVAATRAAVIQVTVGDTTGEEAARREQIAVALADHALRADVLAAQVAAEVEILLTPWADGVWSPGPQTLTADLTSPATGALMAYNLTFAFDATGPCPGNPAAICAQLRIDHWATPETLTGPVRDEILAVMASLPLPGGVAEALPAFNGAESVYGKRSVLTADVRTLRPYELVTIERKFVVTVDGTILKDETTSSSTTFEPAR
jgi:hypothetical protein